MFLSNRDIRWSIECGKLIVDPKPEEFGAGYDETGIDLHLGTIETNALVWDIQKYEEDVRDRNPLGTRELPLGRFDFPRLSRKYLVEVPHQPKGQVPADLLVYRRGDEVVVRRFGFLLWTTKERIGTPVIDPQAEDSRHPELICFVNAKSTKARAGLMVHFTAPTIHANWAGNVTLEITNLGPFDFVLKEDDAIAQLTVATISSAPDINLRKAKSMTANQRTPAGSQG